jgi:hypothetical protein
MDEACCKGEESRSNERIQEKLEDWKRKGISGAKAIHWSIERADEEELQSVINS